MENERFLLLLSRRLAGEASEEELRELEEALNDHPLLAEKYDLLNTYWDKKRIAGSQADTALEEVLSKIRQLEDDLLPVPAGKPFRTVRYIKLKQAIKIAAAVILMAGAGYFLQRAYMITSRDRPVKAAVLEEKQTAKGVKSTIALSDGTQVHLNAGSRLRFPAYFSGSTREIYLSGEAFFDVAKDPVHPFIIHTDKMSIRVLGTVFNVKSYPEDSAWETTLIKGKIEVTLKDRPSDRIILKPNEKLVVANLPERPDTPAAESRPVIASKLMLTNLTYYSRKDSEIVETSWVDNKLIFQDEDFEDLAVKMERWYNVDIRFANDLAKQYHFTGIFEKETVRQALDALRLIDQFNYKINGNIITIY